MIFPPYFLLLLPQFSSHPIRWRFTRPRAWLVLHVAGTLKEVEWTYVGDKSKPVTLQDHCERNLCFSNWEVWPHTIPSPHSKFKKCSHVVVLATPSANLSGLKWLASSPHIPGLWWTAPIGTTISVFAGRINFPNLTSLWTILAIWTAGQYNRRDSLIIMLTYRKKWVKTWMLINWKLIRRILAIIYLFKFSMLVNIYKCRTEM